MDQEIRQMESEGIRSPHPMIQRVRELYDGPVVARVFSDRILSPEWSGEGANQRGIGRIDHVGDDELAIVPGEGPRESSLADRRNDHQHRRQED